MFIPPRVSRNDPADAARAVRRWLKLDEQNNFDSYRAAIEARGVLVFRSNGYAGRWQIAKESPILGFSLYDKRCPVILVKKVRWETQQVFTMMHELGHLLMHRSGSIDDEEDMEARAGDEKEANAFAGHLLVPDEFLSSISDADRPTDPKHSDAWLEPQRQVWGVSVEMILRRLLDTQRITQTFYAAYRAHVRGLPVQDEASGSRTWRHREPKHIFGEPFVRTVLDALASRRITATRACSYLRSEEHTSELQSH